MYRATLVGGAELPLLECDFKGPTLEFVVPGNYWHQLQPYEAGVLLHQGEYARGCFYIDTVEQDDAPYGPIRVTARRAS